MAALCPECELENCMCHMESVECENCNGSGWEDYEHNGKCSACCGTGQLWQPQSATGELRDAMVEALANQFDEPKP